MIIIFIYMINITLSILCTQKIKQIEILITWIITFIYNKMYETLHPTLVWDGRNTYQRSTTSSYNTCKWTYLYDYAITFELKWLQVLVYGFLFLVNKHFLLKTSFTDVRNALNPDFLFVFWLWEKIKSEWILLESTPIFLHLHWVFGSQSMPRV